MTEKENKGKNSIMKMLLSSGSSGGTQTYGHPPRLGTPTSSVPSPLSEAGEDSCPMLSSYLNQVNVAGQMDSNSSWSKVHIEHNYARCGNESLDLSHVRPTKTLFMTKVLTSSTLDDMIDVVAEPVQPTPPYDMAKAQQVMEECEKCVGFVRLDDEEPEDWEETISRTGWTASQNALFNKVVKVLHADRLARLANSGDKNEPVIRRIFVDKSAQRFREAMASVMWDTRLTQWLHLTLIENLGTSYLAAYLDILQTLKCRIPTLIDKMMSSNSQLAKTTPVGAEGLNLLLKRPWDPAASTIHQHKLRKLPGNPIIILVPSGVKKQQSMTPRAHLWSSHLSSLGNVINVASSLGHLSLKMTTQACLEQLITSTKSKIAEVRGEYPGRPVVLAGWRSGAALACQVAVSEIVTAVVCLGFSTCTVEGPRGTPDDSILDVQCPVLFVTGENAATAKLEDLEDMREKMRVQTGLLVVGSADDCLRMSKAKKRKEGVTQSMVDRCILEEIGDFLAGILTAPKPLMNMSDARRVFARRRHNSTTSSVDSESSNAKRSRPGTPQSQTPMVTSTLQKTQTLANVNGSIKLSPMRVSTRGRKKGGRRSNNVVMNTTFHTNVTNQVAPPTSTNGGITVNIGSLASLGPMGPLRMGPNVVASTSTSLSTFIATATTTKPQQLVAIDAAPPEDVIPQRDSSEGSQSDLKTVSPTAITNQAILKTTPRTVTPSSSNQISPVVQQNTPKPVISTVVRIPAAPQLNTIPREEKKPVATTSHIRHVMATNPRIASVTSGNRGTATIQLLDKTQPLTKSPVPVATATAAAATATAPAAPVRPVTSTTVLNPERATRPQIRSVPRTPTIIKTSPAVRPTGPQAALRGQKFALAHNTGKFVTSSGTNIILLENSNGQQRPMIVPIAGSSTKISPQLKAAPQKIVKPIQITPNKPSPVAKLAMSKKIISTNSLLQQRPVLLRNRPATTTKTLRAENIEVANNSAGSVSEITEIPIYITEEGDEESILVEEQEPVVIPIIDASKMKSKKSLPKEISYTEDGDSISFPLDCEIEEADEDSSVKVLIGTMNRVVKTPQIFVTKSTPNVKKLKSFFPNKRSSEEEQIASPEKKEPPRQHGQVIYNEKQEAKYFINYDENEEGVLYEIIDEN